MDSRRLVNVSKVFILKLWMYLLMLYNITYLYIQSGLVTFSKTTHLKYPSQNNFLVTNL